jgi:hypothetical protein
LSWQAGIRAEANAVSNALRFSYQLASQRLVLVWSLVAAAAWSTAVAADDHDGNVIESFEVGGSGGHLLVPVTVAGREYKFVLDTGSSTNAFDISLRPHLHMTGSTMRLRGQSARAPLCTCATAAVGRSKLPLSQESICYDLAGFRKAAGKDVYGLVGMSFLREHVLRIDFDNGEAAFLRSSRNAMGDGVAIEFDDWSVPCVVLAVAEDDPVRFGIDTGMSGATDGSLARATLAKLEQRGHFAVFQGNAKQAGIDGIAYETKVGLLRGCRLGAFHHSDILLTEGRRDKLDMGYISRYHATFDFPRRRLYLAKGRHFDRITEPRLRVIFSVVDGKLLVWDLSSGRLGEKIGLQRGDRILAVDGRPVGESGPDELRTLFADRGHDIRLQLVGAGDSGPRDITIAHE